jgi:type IV pilus assembly protein PilB
MLIKKVINKQLGELLIEHGIINDQQLQKALAVQKEKGGLVGELLVALGFAKEEDIAQAITVQYGFPYLPLSSYEIGLEITALIPVRVAKQYLLIPIDKIGNNLTIAMANPLNSIAIDDVEKLTGCTVQVFVCTVSDVKKAIEKYYKVS